MKNLTTQQAKEFLKSKGYYVDNLWHVDDVLLHNCECTEGAAQGVLDYVMTNDWTISNINELIEEEVKEISNYKPLK